MRALILTVLLSLPFAIIGLAEGSDLFYHPEMRQLLFLSKAIGSAGYVGLALTLALASRWHWIDRLYGGLDRAYRAHHKLGLVAFSLILLHPAVLAYRWGDKGCWWLLNHLILLEGRTAVDVGVAAFWLIVLAILLTLVRLLPYHIWKQSHRLLDLAFLLATVHAFWAGWRHPVIADLLYLAPFALLGLTTIGWRWFHHDAANYNVVEVNHLSPKVVTIRLEPIGDGLTIHPGQYAYWSFRHPSLSREWHPFTPISISKSGAIELLVKGRGDFTNRLIERLTTPSVAVASPPFGQFHYSKGGRRQIWIAGGVGIAPFLAWAERIDSKEYAVDLYACIHDEAEQVCSGLERVNLHVRCTGREGHLEIEGLDIDGADIFICGPSGMIKEMRGALRKRGVSRRKVYYEEFETLYSKRGG